MRAKPTSRSTIARPKQAGPAASWFANRRVTVMGLGRFGGGAGVTQWLAQQGASVLVTDLQSTEKLAEPLADIQGLIEGGQVRTRLGKHAMDDFVSCDLVIANPAVPKPWENTFIRAAIEARVPVTTEIQLVVERLNRNRVIGVTGSAGKSTTAAMIHHILRGAGFGVHFGGNIGGSLLSRLHQIDPNDWIVLELSSAMLYWLGEGLAPQRAKSQEPTAALPGWSPHVAVLTNIEPNHIDWHGSFEHYRESKLNIFRHQEDGDHRVGEASRDQGIKGSKTLDASKPRCLSLKVPGEHNQRNARMAIEAAHKATGIDPLDAGTLLADFPGLPHRLQLVAEHGSKRFYSDSKSTTPQATILAVQSFPDPSKVHLIAGGYDKKIDLSPIGALAPRLAGVYTIGATGEALAKQAKSGFARYCGTLDRAFELAQGRMKNDHILLLSPGCASWDQFTNYEERGDFFAQLARASA